MENSPLALWSMGVRTAQMLADAHTVIGLRLLGMAGMWSVAPTENHRMVSEKMQAFTKAGTDAQRAFLRGDGILGAADAALEPIRRTASANVRRLMKRGPARL